MSVDDVTYLLTVCCIMVVAEMVVPEVNKEMLTDLEGMGFSTARSTRALHFSGI